MTYRTGRHNARTIYLQAGTEPGDSDVQVGTMDTPELGRAVADALNARELWRAGQEANSLMGGREQRSPQLAMPLQRPRTLRENEAPPQPPMCQRQGLHSCSGNWTAHGMPR